MSARETGWDEGAMRPARSGPVAWLLRGLKIGAVAIGIAAGSIGAYCGVTIYEGNFHAVEDGVLYRSAQPGRADLVAAARQYGIRSVLNLRGAHRGEAWYADEIAGAREAGLAHYDYALSAKRFVTAEQIAAILAIVRDAPKPLLIHCKSGSDRTGLVAALYRYAIGGAGADQADGELSLLYGHFPYLTSRSGAMDDSFWAYVRDNRRPAAR